MPVTLQSQRLALFDVDGTLLDSHGEPYPHAQELISVCSASYQVALCSARPLVSLRRLVNTFPETMFLAASQGAIVTSRESIRAVDWSLLVESTLRRPKLGAAVELTNEFGCDVLFHTASGWFAAGATEGARNEAAVLGIPPDLSSASTERDDIVKLAILSNKAINLATLALALQQRGLQANLSKPTYLEVISSGASQTKGGLEIQGLRTISRENTIAVGDAKNDIGMFSSAAMSWTFEKAADEVKIAATTVLPNPEAGGLGALAMLLAPMEPS